MTYFARYVVVGSTAFLLHVVILEALLAAGLSSATAASAIGFVAACILNFTLQRTIVFHSRRGWRMTALRYVVVTLAMLGLNSTVFFISNAWLGVPPIVAQTVTTGAVFVLNFFCNRHFTFAMTAVS